MKAYNVILISKNPYSIIRVRQTMQGLGKFVEEDSGMPYVALMKVLPMNQDNSCSTIRNLIRKDVDVFSDKVMVSLISPDCASFVNWDDGDSLVSGESFTKVKRNFERFDTRHEAFVAYELEKPRWVYDDGVNMAINMDLDEWCWLPIKPDGIYERSKYQKYIHE